MHAPFLSAHSVEKQGLVEQNSALNGEDYNASWLEFQTAGQQSCGWSYALNSPAFYKRLPQVPLESRPTSWCGNRIIWMVRLRLGHQLRLKFKSESLMTTVVWTAHVNTRNGIHLCKNTAEPSERWDCSRSLSLMLVEIWTLDTKATPTTSGQSSL